MVCPSSLISLLPTIILSIVLAVAAPLPSPSSSSVVFRLSERAAPVIVAPVAPVIVAPVAPVAPAVQNNNNNNNNNKPDNPYHLRQAHIWHPRQEIEPSLHQHEEERNQITPSSESESTLPRLPRQLLGRRYNLHPKDQRHLSTPELNNNIAAAAAISCEDHYDEEEPVVAAHEVALIKFKFDSSTITTITHDLEWSEIDLEELPILRVFEEVVWMEHCEEEEEFGNCHEGNDDAYDLILQYEEEEKEEMEELDLERGGWSRLLAPQLSFALRSCVGFGFFCARWTIPFRL